MKMRLLARNIQHVPTDVDVYMKIWVSTWPSAKLRASGVTARLTRTDRIEVRLLF